MYVYGKLHFKYNYKGRLKVKGLKKINHISLIKEKGIAVLASDKVDFGARKWPERTSMLLNSERVNPSRGHSNPKCTNWRIKKYVSKNWKDRKDRELYHLSWDQHPSLTWLVELEKKSARLQHSSSTINRQDLVTYVQNTPPDNNRIHSSFQNRIERVPR